MEGDIGHSISACCERLGMSLVELSEASGVPESRIRDLMQEGKASMADLHAIAKVLYVDIDELLDSGGSQAIAPALWCRYTGRRHNAE